MFGKLAPGSSIPVGVLLAGDGSRVFVAHTNAHAVSVYDPASWERTALLSAGPEPDGMGWSPLSVRR
jgi:DNA-binding beta-propeller fold protein YncE